jgi:hypothetical protein
MIRARASVIINGKQRPMNTSAAKAKLMAEQRNMSLEIYRNRRINNDRNKS